jgi:DNA polymerase-3 subunit epsilon
MPSELQTLPDTIAVVDFETTGMGPAQGARATEIAVVLVQGGRIVGRYQNLMKTGVWVPPFITQLTGITNAMLRGAPPAEAVMCEVAEFTRGVPLVAHNAAFDRGFWQAEMAQAGLAPDAAHEFACTVLLSRRLYPEAPSHKLSSLTQWLGLQRDGRAHRAMSDADVTAQLLLRMQRDVADQFGSWLQGCEVDHGLLAHLQRAPRGQLQKFVERYAEREARLKTAAKQTTLLA